MQLKQSTNWILEKPFFSILSFVVVLTPLIISRNTNELFEFPKMFFIYYLGIILFALYLTSLVVTKQKVFFPSLAVLLFLFSNIVSTIFSSFPYTSFWGYYTRFNDGLLSILVFFLIYFVSKNKLNSKDLDKLIKISLLSVIPVSLIGITQHFGIGTQYVERIHSTLGQPNWVAQYLVIQLPLILYLLVVEVSVIASFLLGFLFILGFSCLWFTYSLSGIIGLIVVTIALLGVLKYKRLLNRRTILKIGFVYFLCLVISIFNLGIYKDKLSDALNSVNLFSKGVSSTEVKTKEVTQGDSKEENINVENNIKVDPQSFKVSDPGFIRFNLWRGSINLFLSSPKIFFIGTGPETYPYTFQPFRPASLNYSSEWDYLFNKPHNYYLEILTELGILGFISYIYLLFVLFKKLPFYLIPGLVGFAVTNIFGWPVVSTSLLFWIYLSFSESRK